MKIKIILFITICLSINCLAQIKISESFETNKNKWYFSDSTTVKINSSSNNQFLSIKHLDNNEFRYSAKSFLLSIKENTKLKLCFKFKGNQNGGIWIKPIDSLRQNIYYYSYEINPSKKWKQDSLDFIIPENTKYLQIGFKLFGKGEVRFDDLLIKQSQYTSQDSLSYKKSKDFLSHLKQIISENALNKDSINWEKDFKEALEFSTYTPDKYLLGARMLLNKLKDNHSYIKVTKAENEEVTNRIEIKTKLLANNRVGYIQIPAYSSPKIEEFAQLVQSKIKEIDRKDLNKWIIDLRNNSGGNVWAMLSGLKPFLQNGVQGYFENKEKIKVWNFKNGQFFIDNEIILEKENTYKLKSIEVRIIVLIDKNTASSAEMLALIFKNYPNCLLVGSETKGLTTSNSNFPLNENLTLFLTTGRMLDSDKKYLEKIPADIFIKNIDLSNNKEVLSWFKEMN